MPVDHGKAPALLLPQLRGFYDLKIPFSWLVVRFGVGWILLVHGYGKLMRGMPAQGKILDVTLPHNTAFNLSLSYLLCFVEVVGGLCIILGLFTRFFAAANAIEMGFLTSVAYWSTGYSW